jgi:hypothetical protein
MIIKVEKIYGFNNFSYSITLQDGKKLSVPNETANKDYQDIQEYIKNGGEIIDNPPLPADEISE